MEWYMITERRKNKEKKYGSERGINKETRKGKR
jgi:hypothetical protein